MYRQLPRDSMPRFIIFANFRLFDRGFTGLCVPPTGYQRYQPLATPDHRTCVPAGILSLSTSSIGQPGYLCHAIPPSENRLAIETMAIVVSSCRLCPTGGPQISPQLDTKGTFHRRLKYCVGLQQSWSRPDPSSQVSRTCEKMVRG